MNYALPFSQDGTDGFLGQNSLEPATSGQNHVFPTRFFDLNKIPSDTITASTALKSSWFLRPEPPETDAPRLFCFPCAGHGAAMYQSWFRAAGGRLDVFPVQPPGRANRLSEAPLESISDFVRHIVPEIAPLTERPYAFFGHSMGAILAAFTAEALVAEGVPGPDHLFLSSRQPPDVPSPVPPLAHLEDDAFIREINRRYNAIPDEIMREPEVLAILLPALRADVRALESIEGHPRRQLDAPITVYGGDSDKLVPRTLLEQWEGWTRGPFRLRMFRGGHFYLHERGPELLREMADMLDGIAGGVERA
jgi:medium-chain acyl-[acyl-carrier-protein] hydrolase